MRLARDFALGLLAALVIILAVLAGYRLSDYVWLGLLALPLVALAAAAVFTPLAGWWRRLVRGAVGLVLAGLAGLGAFLYLKGRTDWFRWNDEIGGDLFVLILCLCAAVPGGIASAAASPARGLALAGGLASGLCAALALTADPDPGVMLLLALGVLVGALVGALDRGARA